MKNDELKEDVLQLLSAASQKPLSAVDIASRLDLKGKPRKHLEKALHELVVAGDIVVVRHTLYALGKPADLVTGNLNVVRSGNAYVDRKDGGESVFVQSRDIGTALPGDRVVVRLLRESGKRVEGKVIRVLERLKRQVVGTLNSTDRFLYVVPLDPAYTRDFYVPDAAGAKVGERVVVEVASWENRHVNPEAIIVEVLGAPDNPDVDTLSVIRDQGLRDEFPPEVLRESETVAARVNEPGEREDIRDKLIVTIDPETARDFDDALSLDTDAEGNRVLGVHIADVSHFVQKDSALDKEAFERGTSVYLPDKVLPMLPEQLSNGVCSLRPNEDRLAFSAFMTVNSQGVVVDRRFARTWIRSKRRLTYEQAFRALGGKIDSGDVPPVELSPDEIRLLRDLNTLAQMFRKRRYARHALELDVPECKVVLDAAGHMTGLRTVVNDLSHQLVEECMVAANEAVATELHNKAIPNIARLHEPPDETKIEDLTADLISLGYKPGDLSVRRNLATFLRSVADDPLAHHVRVAVLRSMKRAVYSAEATGHYGLSKKFYSHFTSPIRRYPDLVSHRQLASMLLRRPPAYQKRTLVKVSMDCSEHEQIADKAERAVVEIKKYRYLAAQIEAKTPGEYAASIIKVMNFGIIVDLPELQLAGMVHVSAISPEFVRYSRESGTLRAGSKIYKVGDALRVFPVRVDFDKRQIDFGLCEEPRKGKRGRRDKAPAGKPGKRPASGSRRARRQGSRNG